MAKTPSRRKQEVPFPAERASEAQDAVAPVQQPPGDASPARTTSESMASEPSEEDIRLRAYHMYLERGGDHGRDFDDWLKATEELRRKREERR